MKWSLIQCDSCFGSGKYRNLKGVFACPRCEGKGRYGLLVPATK